MGRWYYFAGFSEFRGIVREEAVLSLIERLKRNLPKQIEKIERIMSGDDEESLQRKCVFFTGKEGHPCSRGKDVRLCFELDRNANYDGILALPSLSLEFLAEIGVVRRYYDLVRQVLESEHNGKYRKVPVRVTH